MHLGHSTLPQSSTTMNRRTFLTSAGLATAYSVFVRADGLAEAHAAPPTHEEISKAFDNIAPPSPASSRFAGEPHMTLVDLSCDVFVAGGGLAGVCAAVSAARHGAKVILTQD